MQISLGRLRIARLPTVLHHLGEWWLKEFLNLFPERIVDRLFGRGGTMLLLTADQEVATLELLNGAHTLIASERASLTDNALEQIDRFLRSHGLERREADIGLRLPAESGFCRKLLLPAEAAGAIEAIVAEDLAKKTPFKFEDIYCDHVAIERADGDKITVWQWIVRRQYVHQALLHLKMDIGHLAFIVFDGSVADRPLPFINLRPSSHTRNSWCRKTTWAFCCSALIFALLAGSLKYYNQQTALDRLEAQIVTTNGKAQQVRALIDQLQEKKNALRHLRVQRNETPGLLDLWEEATRVLPSHSWLTEFRLAETAGKHEEQVSILGLSSAAPSLVGIFDSSPLFFGAALTSPVAFDATEGRERFALQAKVKMPDPLKEATR
jgi:general secretion pathway protein L